MTNQTLNILKIDSSGRKEGSISRGLTKSIAERFAVETSANIVERDVSQGLNAVSESWIAANFTPADQRTDDQKALLKTSDSLVAELRAADVLVIGLPIYNFGVPAALKEWVDLICRAGETFKYSETGPEGLLTGKRAIVAVASGGVPLGAPVDHATPYLKQVLSFIGITDVSFVSATGMAVDPEATLKAANAEVASLPLGRVA